MGADLFGSDSFGIEDLLLLEPFQVSYLPGYAPERELAAVLHASPMLKSHLIAKCPSISDFIERIMGEFGAAADELELQSCGERLVRGIPDLIGYNKAPEVYDAQEFHNWDFREVTDIVSLKDKTILDVGSGTGRVALEAAEHARHVFAVEPVGRLRRFIRERAAELDLSNPYVVDGFGHAIPFPDGFADVLITSHALGWKLEDELKEFERVTRPGGFIIHCPGTADRESNNETHECLISAPWNYEFARYEEADGTKRKYWKQMD